MSDAIDSRIVVASSAPRVTMSAYGASDAYYVYVRRRAIRHAHGQTMYVYV